MAAERFVATATCRHDTEFIAHRLKVLGAGDLQPLLSQHKVLFTFPLERVPSLLSLARAQRVFIALLAKETTPEHPLFAPDLEVLAGWAASVNWDRILRAWAAIHSRTPQTWTLDCKRYGPHGCAARRIDKLALQQRLRAALHTSLPQLHHESTAPDLLIVFNVSGSLTVAGIPILSQRPARPTILHKGLHHSICWGLGAAARLQMGDVVLDPMCGKGAVLFEAAHHWDHCVYIGADWDPSQLALARDNVEGVDTVRTPKQRQRWAKGTPAQKAAAPRPTPNISLLRADARDLPVRSGSVDAVLCDLPFGRQHGSPEGNVALYPAVLSEVMRVLRPAGRAVLLTDDASSRVLIAAVGGSGLQLYRAVPFEYCALHCVLHLIQKPAPGSADPGPGFDDDLLARLEGGAWADCKPRMDWYRPKPGRPD